MPGRSNASATILVGGLIVACSVLLMAWRSGWIGPDPTVHHAESIAVRPAHGRTNLVLIVIDTMRYDHFGTLRGVEITPNLTRLAERGVAFTRFFSTSSWTRPAMASMLTGLYPRSTGVHEEQFDVLPEAMRTLAERLRGEGWLTLGLTANPTLNAVFGFQQGFDEYHDSVDVWFHSLPRQRGRRRGKTTNATAVTDEALAMIDARPELQAGRSFYLQLLYLDPHFPYRPPDAALEAVGGGTGTRQRYAGEVWYADREVGRLLEGLERRGLLEDTLVIVTSDHGEGLDDHRGLPASVNHGDTLYDSVVHVPLVMQHPELPPGTRVEGLASTVDLLPTVLDVLGLALDPDLPGRSLRPAAAAPSPALGDEVFTETRWRYTAKVAVITPTHKWIRNDDCRAWHADGTHEQRTLEPKERAMLERIPPEELYLRPTRTEIPRWAVDDERVAARLRGRVEAWEARTPMREPEGRDPEDVIVLGDGTVVSTAAGGQVPTLDAETEAQLRALGYLGGSTE